MSKNSPETSKLDAEFIIRDLETLKVTADPLRLQLLETFGSRPQTVKAVSKKIGKPAGKLYYHVNLLEKHGLLRVVETRMVSGIVEKHYQVTAHTISVDPALLSPEAVLENGGGVKQLLDSIFENTRADIQRSAEAGLLRVGNEENIAQRPFILRNQIHLTPAQYTAFQKKVEALLEELKEMASHATQTDENSYGILIALYPTVTGAENPEDPA